MSWERSGEFLGIGFNIGAFVCCKETDKDVSFGFLASFLLNDVDLIVDGVSRLVALFVKSYLDFKSVWGKNENKSLSNDCIFKRRRLVIYIRLLLFFVVLSFLHIIKIDANDTSIEVKLTDLNLDLLAVFSDSESYCLSIQDLCSRCQSQDDIILILRRLSL